MERSRSPFGELVFRHRRRLSLTQLDVANLSRDISEADFQASPISDRRIAAFERRTSGPEQWTAPHPSTLRTLVSVFRLKPDSEEYHAFTEAARYVRDMSRAAPVHQQTPPVAIPAPRERESRQFVPEGREPHLQRLR